MEPVCSFCGKEKTELVQPLRLHTHQGKPVYNMAQLTHALVRLANKSYKKHPTKDGVEFLKVGEMGMVRQEELDQELHVCSICWKFLNDTLPHTLAKRFPMRGGW